MQLAHNQPKPETLLMKVGKKEHLESFIAGHIYFNTIAYFKQEETLYRGDCREGEIYLDTKHISFDNIPIEQYFKSNLPMLDTIELTTGFTENNSSFVFCAVSLDQSSLTSHNNPPNLSKKTISEMKQFGQFAVVFQQSLFTKNLNDALARYDENLHWGSIRYCDKKSPQDVAKCIASINKPESAAICFLKDNFYKDQNEWRYMLSNFKGKIPTNPSGGFQVKIDRFPHFPIFNLNDIK